MELVQRKEEIVSNLKQLESYLQSSDPESRQWACERVKAGRSLIAYKISGETRFAPSRFIGYKDNTIEDHEANKGKDGRETNPAIGKILKLESKDCELKESPELESAYINYCDILGIGQPSNFKRTFWATNWDL